jgi:hypothetical protein
VDRFSKRKPASSFLVVYRSFITVALGYALGFLSPILLIRVAGEEDSLDRVAD